MHDPLDDRLKVLDAEPDSCSLTMGTTNFGDDVFSNPWPFVCELYQLSQEREVVPEFELFDLGQVHALQRLLDKYGLPYGGRVHVDLVMGVPGGMHGTADALVAGGRRAAGRGDQLVGDRHRSLHARRDARGPVARAATCGSAWRTCSRSAGASRSSSNAQLVERAVGGGPAGAAHARRRPARTRQLLGLAG